MFRGHFSLLSVKTFLAISALPTRASNLASASQLRTEETQSELDGKIGGLSFIPVRIIWIQLDAANEQLSRNRVVAVTH
jgi:hypothetical protein